MARENRKRPMTRAGGLHGRPHRMMAVWTARHDNGWLTSVVENPNGSFAAWAAPEGESGGVYSIQEEAEAGKEAAAAALGRESDHTECSDACSAWTLQTYAVFDRRQDVGRDASRTLVTRRKKAAPVRRSA
jgi:hypothetical protein